MHSPVIEIDLHGKNVYQSRIAIDAALRRASAACFRIRIIHGFNSGATLRDFIDDEYAHHPKVLRMECGANRGVTELVLREY